LHYALVKFGAKISFCKHKNSLTHIKKISVYQYRNIGTKTIDFSDKVTCLHGPNGCGKTNVLDAIYALAYSKSYFTRKDALLVQYSVQGMSLSGQYSDHSAKMLLRETGKKELYLNESELKQVQQYLGHTSCVMIAPDDISLINDGGEERRKYLDSILTLIQPDYSATLGKYNKILQQRNALLKNWHNLDASAQSVLEFYNQQLADFAAIIFAARKALMIEIEPLFIQRYSDFSADKEKVEIKYTSTLFNSNLLDQLSSNFHKDLASQRTNYGIHKDDISMLWQTGESFKETASQGQRKTMLFALKLAQYQILKTKLGNSPTLLLDDVFEKLDEQRGKQLLQFILQQDGQTIITDTHLARLQAAFGDSKEVAYLSLG
jgi:DNA replication and repair protein RecF